MRRRRSHGLPAGLLPAAGAAVLLGAVAQQVDDRVVDVLAASVRTVVVVAVWLLVRRRACTPGAQRGVWTHVAHACAVVAASGVLDLVVVVLGRGAFVERVVLTVFALISYLLFYRGLLHWNRVGTSTAPIDDWLNGICSVLVAAGLGNLLVALLAGGRWNGWTWWQLQVWLLPVCGLTVALGTLLTVARLAGFLHDRRVLVLGAGAAVGLVVNCVAAAAGDYPVDGNSVMIVAPLSAVVIAWCASTAVPRTAPQPVSNLSTTIGSLVVAATAIVVLVGSTRLDPHRSLAPVLFAGAALLGMGWRQVAVVRDLTQLVASRRQALTDDLTDLPNRRAFAAQLQAGPKGLLMVLDLDGFKDVNDRHGHHAGDELLREVGRRWSLVLPAGASLARLGGDEFAVVVPGAGVSAGRALAAAFAETLEQVDVGGWHPRVSVGIALGDGEDGGELLRRADAAMYLAKASGTGTGVYDGEVDRAVRARALLIEELLDVCSGDRLLREFVVHYQPQIATATGELVGVEALVRWHHPRLGVLKPEAFIEIVEDRGLMPFLTDHVLRRAVGQQRDWAQRGLDVRMSVNLSAGCLDHPELIPTLDEIAAAERLVVEVTETALMADPAAALAACHEIVRRGIGLSIDDYGTGYSSMSYLAVLPATELKIDRSFTAEIAEPRIRSIVSATVELAHSLGMRVVAEGVETPDHLTAVRALGADETQGFLHSRPLTAHDLERWWRERELLAENVPARAFVRRNSAPQSVAVSMTKR